MSKFENRQNLFGFTLVELLIVITLLGVLALIVITTINPVEQANRSRDTRFRSDSSELLSAIERYFTQMSEFPWVTSGAVVNNDVSFGYVSAGNRGVGICGASCGTDGYLITSLELKNEFRNRDFIKSALPDKQLFVGKATGPSQSTYVCFVPASKAVRDKAIADGHVYTVSSTGGTKSATSSCDTTWSNSCYVCVPE